MKMKRYVGLFALLAWTNVPLCNADKKMEVVERICRAVRGERNGNIPLIEKAMRDVFCGGEPGCWLIYDFGQFFPDGCNVPSAFGDNVHFIHPYYGPLCTVCVNLFYDHFPFTCRFSATAEEVSLLDIVLTDSLTGQRYVPWSRQGYDDETLEISGDGFTLRSKKSRKFYGGEVANETDRKTLH